MDHSAEYIVRCIRQTDDLGQFVMPDHKAAFLVNLFASVEIVKAERANLKPPPPVHIVPTGRPRLVVVGDHLPEISP